ncbi:trimethyllysine dioxygenase, mitochondrial-like isoform X2 [Colias croceus]|uniref:trimethyllysine dioxygenase, mitochondrial-like isoform X2 n=1 Tax=Colias crocea TaxID=72248 RepID=UPI001E27F565|nr:trimethyllysine dioxygenase, mitochondrial-like isoform X2 [Colias croceus]
MKTLKSYSIDGRTLKLVFDSGLSINFEDCWLRDHCRCKSCFHIDTNQRAKHLLEIPDVTFVKATITADTILSVQWSDGHESSYKTDFLVQFDYKTWCNKRKSAPKLWRGPEVATRVARVSADEFINSTDGAKLVFQSLLDYGVALIEQVEPTPEATEAVGKALGGVQHTFFGGMWSVSTNAEHADTAYSNITLKEHTDNTYFTEPAGLQMFHCTEHSNGTGGESVFMDGFYAATKLKEEHPEDFEFLTKFEVEAEYIEEGHFHKCSAPVIQLDRFNDIKQIRFNSYDRSPMAFANAEECRAYYRSLRNLAKYFEDSKNQWHIKLKPGFICVFDNFRVLHGRAGFTGKRVLWGCYVSRADWLNRARTLGLIP